jgi:hypothetical protein
MSFLESLCVFVVDHNCVTLSLALSVLCGVFMLSDVTSQFLPSFCGACSTFTRQGKWLPSPGYVVMWACLTKWLPMQQQSMLLCNHLIEL